MKRYLICDDNDINCNKLSDYNDLKELLINEIERDTFENIDNKDIVMNNFKMMKILTKDEYNFKFIKNELESFGWYIQDLVQLQQDLSNFQAYKHGSGIPIIPNDCIEETLKMIESELKK